MGRITRVFWQKNGNEKDTYFQGAVSYENALEVVKALQGASSADVVRVSHGVGAVVPSLASLGRRAFLYDVDPDVVPVNLSAFKLSGEGQALTQFLAVRLMSGRDTFSLTVPAPLFALLDRQEMQDAFLQNVIWLFQSAARVKITRSRIWLTSPNIHRRQCDEYVQRLT